MNLYLISILLGVVEGLTEFLPVSSTAHLRVAERLLGLDMESGYWKMYTIVIQLGAVLAVVVYFRARIQGFLQSFPRGTDGDKTALTHPLTLVLGATAVTAGPAYLLDKRIGENLENLWVMGGALIAGGVLMWAIDAVFTRPRVTEMERVSWPQAVLIGAAQILAAAFPGTSRSMATIAAGQVAGLARPAALEFSFFLSIPVMFAATGLKLFQAAVLGKGFGKDPLQMTGELWGVLAVGFAVSFVVAWAVIAWFMAWVRRRGFAPFAVYRIVAGAAVLFMAWRAGAA